MKDFRLSEIVENCSSTRIGNEESQNCTRCAEKDMEFHDFCQKNFLRCPLNWGNIPPRDIIEFPYKNRIFDLILGKYIYQIVFFNEMGFVVCENFEIEAEADKFSDDLKMRKVNIDI